MTDIEQLLKQTAPTVTCEGDVAEAMGATARTITATSLRRRPHRSRRAGVLVLGTAAAVAVGAVVISGRAGSPPAQPTQANQTRSLTQVQLLAAKSAPSGLPLPDGVTIEDAKAFVAGLVQADPGLRAWGAYVLDHGVLVAHEKGQVVGIPRSMQESGITAAYVFYAQCQWKRTLVGKKLPLPFTVNGKQASSMPSLGHLHSGDAVTETTNDPGLEALMKLGDPSSWSTKGYRAPSPLPGDHEGIGSFTTTPDGTSVTYDADYRTNCTNGFGAAPTGSK